MHFARVPSTESQIKLKYTFPAHGSFELLQDQGGGAGVCVGDFDGDGLPDLFFTHYDQGNQLYRNLGNWHFEDISQRAGIQATGLWCAGATAVDVDNDGDLDLAVAVFNGPNQLFINRGDGTFQEQGSRRGLAFSGASVAFAFEDYDRDGWLDAHLLTHRLAITSEARLPRSSKDSFARGVIRVGQNRKLEVAPEFAELFEIMSKGEGRSELIIAGQKDRLYRNAGNGTFTEVSSTAGIIGNDIGLASHWWDYNADGWPDLYISNDYKGSDRLFENRHDGTFAEVTQAALPCVPWSSMGSDSADINNDGLMDFIATDMSGSSHQRRMQIHVDEKESWFLRVATPKQYPRNMLFLSTGESRVFEIAQLAGVAHTDWTWSPKFGDLDNDGWVDLFIANGMARDFVNTDLLKSMKDRGNRNWITTPVLRESNHAFRNNGQLHFDPVTAPWGLDTPSASYGAALADLDRDGDLDLIVMCFGEEPRLYRNESSDGGRLLIRLKGVRSNSYGIGATVYLTTRFGTQTRRVSLSSGFMSANEPLVHFGLGNETVAESLRVDWPSGHSQSFTNVAANQWLTITEPASPPTPDVKGQANQTGWFRAVPLLTNAVHREQDFDEFSREPLRPWGHSRLGPGLACGDVNGDGREDIYLAGAAGTAGSLWVQEINHQFTELPCPVFQEDAAAEDLGAVFFDLDGDDDLDLYVVSGGVECAEGEAILSDRLYLNDGRGGLTKAGDGLLAPDADSGSTVVAADFDRDGDVDLFVEGRGVPGRYPRPGRNRLLRNEAGKLVDVTDRLAPGLRETGMVTSAVWSDVDNDGWLDLLLAHEWGRIRYFKNRDGKFEEVPPGTCGLLRTGWWNSITAADLDHDGDLDFVVGNLGNNTPYHATEAEPARAFYGDFESTGSLQWIEAYFENHQLFPRRRLETLRTSIPTLLDRFTTAEAYGKARVSDWLTSSAMDKAQRFEMTTLESGVLWNDGAGRFEFRALPVLAQSAPCFGVAVDDFDGDGAPDLCLAQNFSDARLDTGAMAGGIGLVLKGDAKGGFRPVWPGESGLLVPGDGRAIATLDLNGDQQPDCVIAQNNGPLLAFEGRPALAGVPLEIRLHGARGNRAAVGARVSLIQNDRPLQTFEVSAGAGYLSQSSPRIYARRSASPTVGRLKIRWPSGKTDTFEVPASSRSFEAREEQ